MRRIARRSASGCGADSARHRAHHRGCIAPTVHASSPPQAWPTRCARRLAERLDQARDVTGQGQAVVAARWLVRVAVAAQVHGDRAVARRRPSAVSWCRQDHQNSGNPCSSSTSGPSPSSATCSRMPLADTSRCVHGPATRDGRRVRWQPSARSVVVAAVAQGGDGVLGRVDRPLRRADLLAPCGSRGTRTAPAVSSISTKTIRNAAHSGSRQSSSVEAEREEQEEQAEQQHGQRDDEEDAALDALLDLAGDLGLGELDLGSDQGGQVRGRVADEAADRRFGRRRRLRSAESTESCSLGLVTRSSCHAPGCDERATPRRAATRSATRAARPPWPCSVSGPPASRSAISRLTVNPTPPSIATATMSRGPAPRGQTASLEPAPPTPTRRRCRPACRPPVRRSRRWRSCR